MCSEYPLPASLRADPVSFFPLRNKKENYFSRHDKRLPSRWLNNIQFATLVT
ncbi:hypothetical protein CIT292_07036 [Citrobacter youngae ATCC 29220]|uniref:Uncharacterized protein n=1 Tax=Citrobacter youngae ATCC 29220 TaxID=500640 RepID=D4B996_9ENTR|nr:hypothetical protein CIT292_07036 [Citrobacter youngae ATCC 29220]